MSSVPSGRRISSSVAADMDPSTISMRVRPPQRQPSRRGRPGSTRSPSAWEQPDQKGVGREHRIEELARADRPEIPAQPFPQFRRLRGVGGLGQVGHALENERPCAPGAVATAAGQGQSGGDLLRPAEIPQCAVGQSFAVKCDDALIAFARIRTVDGEGEMAVPERCRCAVVRAGEPRGIEPRISAHQPRTVHIGDERAYRSVAADLQCEHPIEVQGLGQCRRQRGRLADGMGDRIRIGMPGQHGVERRAESHKPAAQGRAGEAVRADIVVPERGGRLPAHAPKHQARMPFCACKRFSASSQTADCGPSITPAVTSSPRWAGRQCMNRASGRAMAISCSSTR